MYDYYFVCFATIYLKIIFIMKTLELNQMEKIEAGGWC